MRVLVLVLSFDNEPWVSIEQMQRQSWAVPNGLPNISVCFYYGVPGGAAHWTLRGIGKALALAGQEHTRCRLLGAAAARAARRRVTREGDRILTEVPESYLNVNAKTWAALRHVIKNEQFDYLLRTNTSSYVSLRRLWSTVETLPPKGYYGGFLGNHEGVPFASGAGILMSRDIVEAAVADRTWEFDRIDDVALGRLMARAGVPVQELPRVEVDSLDHPAFATPEVFASSFLVRCKSLTDRGQDQAIMRRVHAVYQALDAA